MGRNKKNETIPKHKIDLHKLAVVVIVCIKSHVTSTNKQQSEAAAGHLQFGQRAAADNVKHCLMFATLTLVTSCKAPYCVAGCTVTLVSLKMVYLCPVSLQQIKSWSLNSGVIHKERADHRGRLPVILPLTGDVYGMSVCPEGCA